jgi:hypothetical protein
MSSKEGPTLDLNPYVAKECDCGLRNIEMLGNLGF